MFCPICGMRFTDTLIFMVLHEDHYREYATKVLGLIPVTAWGSAVREDGIRVHWVNGDYVDPVLLGMEER